MSSSSSTEEEKQQHQNDDENEDEDEDVDPRLPALKAELVPLKKRLRELEEQEAINGRSDELIREQLDLLMKIVRIRKQRNQILVEQTRVLVQKSGSSAVVSGQRLKRFWTSEVILLRKRTLRISFGTNARPSHTIRIQGAWHLIIRRF